MTKDEMIQKEIEKNKKAFGRWHSTRKKNSASKLRLIYEKAPNNELEALQHGNALANTGNYPVGTSGCFNVGISGGCGPECFVYLQGQCEEPQAMIELLDERELSLHYELYSCAEKTDENQLNIQSLYTKK